ncbi:MAG: hypothetical protein J1F11_06345 [Oscillospiraceae bacterium]|nr:hypothetical protein [Oscillospiraceae bacterium]
MSRSIKDYKDAMDNIKISDSFYKRTENMLAELDQVQIEKKSSFGGGRVSAGIMAAAACIVCVIGLRIALDGREAGIDTASPADTVTQTVTDIETAPELIDVPEKERGIFADLPEPEEAEDDSFDAVAAVTEDTDADEGEPAAQTEAKTEAKPKPSTTSAGGKADTPAVTTPAPTKPQQEGAYTGGGNYPSVTVHGYENIPMMDDISLQNVTVEVTPYFDMGSIKSGEGSVKKSGTELASVIDFISDIAASSTEIENDSFKSIFTMTIADENIGVTFYSVYLTDSGTLVITKHSTGVQQRVTYLLKKEDYNTLKHTLFLMFGDENEYTLFENLISGK